MMCAPRKPEAPVRIVCSEFGVVILSFASSVFFIEYSAIKNDKHGRPVRNEQMGNYGIR